MDKREPKQPQNLSQYAPGGIPLLKLMAGLFILSLSATLAYKIFI